MNQCMPGLRESILSLGLKNRSFELQCIRITSEYTTRIKTACKGVTDSYTKIGGEYTSY